MCRCRLHRVANRVVSSEEPLDALGELEALDRAKELADQVAKVWSKASGGLEFDSDIFDEIALDASKTGFHILVAAKAHGEQAKRGQGS